MQELRLNQVEALDSSCRERHGGISERSNQIGLELRRTDLIRAANARRPQPCGLPPCGP